MPNAGEFPVLSAAKPQARCHHLNSLLAVTQLFLLVMQRFVPGVLEYKLSCRLDAYLVSTYMEFMQCWPL